MIFSKIALALSYPFVRYALITGVLISLSASLFGSTLVLRRFSFIGDGLSHVAFGATALASVLNLTNNMYLVLGVTALCAVLLLGGGSKAKIRGDAAIAVVSVGALALGYLIMNIFSKSPNLSGDVCSTLFGSVSILTLTRERVILCAVLSLVVICAFLLFYNRIFSVTFDEDFAAATGMRVKLLNLGLALVLAVIIVLAMNLVGSLLISALLIFPALSAMRLFKSFKAVTVCSAAFALFCSLSGMFISIIFDTPVGATVAGINALVFVLSLCFGRA